MKRINRLQHNLDKPKRVDYPYERNGVVNLIVATEPLAGWRHVEVTPQRTKVDFAYEMQSPSIESAESDSFVAR